MKTKLEMAHEFMMKKMETETIDNHWELFYTSWRYADAMQAEADKREKEEKNEHVFEAVDEWQPDWSQAPDWANWWVAVANQSGKITGGWFYDVEPDFGESKGVSIYCSSNSNSILTDSFGYTGDWRNSLRKRPE